MTKYQVYGGDDQRAILESSEYQYDKVPKFAAYTVAPIAILITKNSESIILFLRFIQTSNKVTILKIIVTYKNAIANP